MKPPRLKRLLQNLALSAVSLLLCVGLLELVLRWCGFGNVEIYEPDPKLFWKLKPQQDCYTKVDRKPVHINAHGIRGPEFPAIKPPNTIRILCLGDSRTFGWGLSEPETYSGVLARLAQQIAGTKSRVEVINAGVNAWSYPQMLAYFRDTGLQFGPDIVILGGANFWTQFSEQSSADFVKKFMTRVRLKNFLRRFAVYHYVVEVKLNEFYSRYRTKFIPVDPELDTLFKDQQRKDPDAVFRGAIEELCRLALSHGVKPLLLYLPALDDLNAPKPSRDLVVKTAVSRALNVPLTDPTPEIAPRGISLYLDHDPVHLNAEGNRIIARKLSASITNWVSP